MKSTRRAWQEAKVSTTSSTLGVLSLCALSITNAFKRSSVIWARAAVAVRSTFEKTRPASAIVTGNVARMTNSVRMLGSVSAEQCSNAAAAVDISLANCCLSVYCTFHKVNSHSISIRLEINALYLTIAGAGYLHNWHCRHMQELDSWERDCCAVPWQCRCIDTPSISGKTYSHEKMFRRHNHDHQLHSVWI